jgi:hypothetical protein
MKRIIFVLLIACVGCSTINIVVPNGATVKITRVESTTSPKVKHRFVMDADGRLGTVDVK